MRESIIIPSASPLILFPQAYPEVRARMGLTSFYLDPLYKYLGKVNRVCRLGINPMLFTPTTAWRTRDFHHKLDNEFNPLVIAFCGEHIFVRDRLGICPENEFKKFSKISDLKSINPPDDSSIQEIILRVYYIFKKVEILHRSLRRWDDNSKLRPVKKNAHSDILKEIH